MSRLASSDQFQIDSPDLIESASLSKPIQQTNTLALLLPHPFLFHPSILDLFRKYYGSFGKIHTWAPIKAFGRVLIVFYEEEDAMRAKREGDRLEVGRPGGVQDGTTQQEVAYDDGSPTYLNGQQPGLVLRLYLAAPTSLTPPTDKHLEPPTLTRNFLISPPGSPPEGWEPIEEDAPNSMTLAADLIKALEAIAVGSDTRRRRRPGEIETIINSQAEGSSAQGPSVTVQDCTPGILVNNGNAEQGAGEEEGPNEEIPEEIFESLEGRRISLVKATIESMGGKPQDNDWFGGEGDAFAHSPSWSLMVDDSEPKIQSDYHSSKPRLGHLEPHVISLRSILTID
ncbi:Calcineurin-mediated signaling pathway inhibitor DSCR1 [Phaffia rhodozyma]|uniref:Calcineurin-mediated signaling pathway inhibitor DSCR1 n=1 Tax=Phaffia rhodozyma TaxID=264483 RepID=A0A0F7SSG1_PHARH|nr:Calcineurin-mediated signaling pathway inhibitor DSCR1 [Phaffia rhodozyma]